MRFPGETPMNLDPAWLLVSLIPGGVGLVLLVYGKKQQRWPQLVAGLAMLVYPYFAATMATLVAGGALIAVALWYALWLGY